MRSLLVFCLLGGSALAAGDLDPDALEHLVRQDCGSCHGLTLRGGLGPDLRREALGHYDRDGLASVILHGVPGTPMPPWKPLITEEEALWIAEYLLNGDGE